MAHSVCLVRPTPGGTETQPEFLQTQAFLSSRGFSVGCDHQVCRFFSYMPNTESINEFLCSWNCGKVEDVSGSSLYSNLKKILLNFLVDDNILLPTSNITRL